MDMTVKEFISTNNNPLLNWEIDGHMFGRKNDIPEDLLDKYVSDWEVSFWDGIISIDTH